MTMTQSLKAFAVAVVAVVAAFAFALSADALTISPVKLELTLDPGEVYTAQYKLTNENKEARTYFGSFENFEANGETGAPSFQGDSTTGLASWMSGQGSITLQPQESELVPFTIAVPANAEPGGYFAGVLWGTSAPATGDAGEVQIGSKMGMLVLVSVRGDVEVGGGIIEFDTRKPGKRWYSNIPVGMFYRFSNDGGDRVKPEGTLLIENLFGGKRAEFDANPTEGNVLPGTVRRFDVFFGDPADQGKMRFFGHVKQQWKNFYFGVYRAHVSLAYGDGSVAHDKINLVMIPWHLLIVIVVLLAIVIKLWRMSLMKHEEKLMAGMKKRK